MDGLDLVLNKDMGKKISLFISISLRAACLELQTVSPDLAVLSFFPWDYNEVPNFPVLKMNNV